MKKEHIDAWVQALRSGEYEQGREQLKDNICNTYCCLGVLADLSIKNNWFSDLNIKWDGPILMVGEEIQWGYLKKQIREVLGLSSGHQELLSEMNDDGESFNTIADYIEKNLKDS